MEQLKFAVSSSPHIRSSTNTSSIMMDVIIALMPAGIYSIYLFGFRSLFVILTSVFTCVLSEYIACKLMKKKSSINDFSAAVTGMLLAFVLPPTVPLWIPVIGGAFAIIIVKMLFGGIGYNFINPALAARTFLTASWPVIMTTWINPGPDGITSATPLSIIKSGGEVIAESKPGLFNLFIGNIPGCIGETSALLLLIGGLYLVFKKVISLEIPLSFIGTVAVFTWLFGGIGIGNGEFMYHILAGGLMIGAFFMATDYTTSPITGKGKVVMGIGCGLITSIIRLYGAYPEGVSYSILLMNLVVPLIDRFFAHHRYGGAKSNA